MLRLAFAVFAAFIICGAAHAKSDADPFYLPQPNQPFDGKVDTRIGKLEFENQYPVQGVDGDDPGQHGFPRVPRRPICGESRSRPSRTSSTSFIRTSSSAKPSSSSSDTLPQEARCPDGQRNNALHRRDTGSHQDRAVGGGYACRGTRRHDR